MVHCSKVTVTDLQLLMKQQENLLHQFMPLQLTMPTIRFR
jgi:hypothetical protein